jgi:hypothetical protein
MAGTTVNIADLKRRLFAELKRDKRKTIVLAALLAIAGIVCGRLVIRHSLPSAAAAQMAGDSLLPPSAQGGSPAPAPVDARRSDRGARREAYLRNLDRRITRDLFEPRLEYFPLLPGKTAVAVGTIGPGWFAAVRDRVLERQRAQSEHLARINAVRMQASALSLTSTILGDAPAAVINGQVVHKGEAISGFKIVDIGSKRCLLSKEGVLVELIMKD